MYENYPDLTGESPVLINQASIVSSPTGLLPSGYEAKTFIAENFGSKQVYSKDLNGILGDVFNTTQKLSYRFL